MNIAEHKGSFILFHSVASRFARTETHEIDWLQTNTRDTQLLKQRQTYTGLLDIAWLTIGYAKLISQVERKESKTNIGTQEATLIIQILYITLAIRNSFIPLTVNGIVFVVVMFSSSSNG